MSKVGHHEGISFVSLAKATREDSGTFPKIACKDRHLEINRPRWRSGSVIG